MLLDVKNIIVRHGGIDAVKGVSLTVEEGMIVSLIGANGAGKTTLLSLILGDHPQVYSNYVRLFGQRRGSGESIWEIKQRIGMVSSEFQVRYRKSISGFDVILSGFFDSVGLFRLASQAQRRGEAHLGGVEAPRAQALVERLHVGQLELQLQTARGDGAGQQAVADRAPETLEFGVGVVVMDGVVIPGQRTEGGQLLARRHRHASPGKPYR